MENVEEMRITRGEKIKNKLEKWRAEMGGIKRRQLIASEKKIEGGKHS